MKSGGTRLSLTMPGKLLLEIGNLYIRGTVGLCPLQLGLGILTPGPTTDVTSDSNSDFSPSTALSAPVEGRLGRRHDRTALVFVVELAAVVVSGFWTPALFAGAALASARRRAESR